NCGKCHNRLPEASAIKAVRYVYSKIANVVEFLRPAAKHPLAFWVLIAIPPLLIASITYWPSMTDDQECAGRPQPREGIHKWYGPLWGADIAELTIKTGAGYDYLVRLMDLRDRPARAFVLHGGATRSFSVPIGTYKRNMPPVRIGAANKKYSGATQSTARPQIRSTLTTALIGPSNSFYGRMAIFGCAELHKLNLTAALAVGALPSFPSRSSDLQFRLRLLPNLPRAPQCCPHSLPHPPPPTSPA